MYTFPELIKQIRKESNLTQGELASALGVSTILVSMIETGQKEVSKGFVKKLAAKLDVPTGTIFPFVFLDKKDSFQNLSGIEKKLMEIGYKMQLHLIQVKSKKLNRYAKKEPLS